MKPPKQMVMTLFNRVHLTFKYYLIHVNIIVLMTVTQTLLTKNITYLSLITQQQQKRHI